MFYIVCLFHIVLFHIDTQQLKKFFLGLGQENVEPLPELSAEEERSDSQCWKSCVIAGVERRIDLKVLEPYKKVITHGGYLSKESHNAIVIFSACFLPDRSRADYDYVMNNLFM